MDSIEAPVKLTKFSELAGCTFSITFQLPHLIAISWIYWSGPTNKHWCEIGSTIFIFKTIWWKAGWLLLCQLSSTSRRCVILHCLSSVHCRIPSLLLALDYAQGTRRILPFHPCRPYWSVYPIHNRWCPRANQFSSGFMQWHCHSSSRSLVLSNSIHPLRLNDARGVSPSSKSWNNMSFDRTRNSRCATC